MSIKSDVLEHLIAHEGEVVSLTALANQLDLQLDQVRAAVTGLRSGTGDHANAVGLKDRLHLVSRGYAVKYTAAPTDDKTSTNGQQPAAVAVPSDPPAVSATGKTLPYYRSSKHVPTDNVSEILGQLGAVSSKVFAYAVSRPLTPVTVDEVAKATGYTNEQVTGAFYNTLSSSKQRNDNAARFFRKVKIGTYMYTPPTDVPAPSTPTKPVGDPIVAKTVKKLYGDKETKVSTQKRIFEELRVLPDGSILIEDENGAVYKAREV